MKSSVLTLKLTMFLCTAFAVTCTGNAAPVPLLTNTEALKKMQGDWEVVGLENDGVPIEAGQDVTTVVVEKERLVIKGVSRREPYTIKLNAATNPARIDMTFDRPKSRPGLGIFKFEADKLVIVCAGVGDPRPEKFDGKTGTRFVLRRAKVGK